MIGTQTKGIYEFGPFRLDPAEHLLLRDGEAVPLRPKVFDILLVLVESRGHLVAKDELIKTVWPDSFVEEGNLNKNISMLRQALGETPTSHQFIETVPKLGYRFVADVQEVQDGTSELLVEKHTRVRITAEEEEETNGRANADLGLRIVGLTPATSLTTAAPVRSGTMQRSVALVAVAMLAIVIVAAAFLKGKFDWTKRSNQAGTRSILSPATLISPVRLTNTGNTGGAVVAISPDGHYVVHTVVEGGKQSLWMRHVFSESNRQIVPPAEVNYFGIWFSRDGNYVYFTKSEANEKERALYRMPALGGITARLIADAEELGLSPDNERIAVVRNSQTSGESTLTVAKTDGGEETNIATRKLPDRFRSPVWSPDGKSVACSFGNAEVGGSRINLIVVGVDDHREQTITSQGWRFIRDVAWLSDGSGLVMTATNEAGRQSQIWYISYPGGEARRITNDLTQYISLSLSADSTMLATVQTELNAKIWLMPSADPNSAKQVSPWGFGGVSWAPDGRIVYTSQAAGNVDLWIMNADGTDQKQITFGAGTNLNPAVSPDGRYVAFVSDRTGTSTIWRMDLDGNNVLPLTHGDGERVPDWSRDGRWVIYNTMDRKNIWKVPVDGGEPVQLTNEFSIKPRVSPDGKLIAFFVRDEHSPAQRKIAVSAIESGKIVKTFDLPLSVDEPPGLRWTADGRALTYVDVRDGVSNVWSQPLDGSRPKQITNFKSDEIFDFDWSRDGKQLACSRGAWNHDVVLIRNFH